MPPSTERAQVITVAVTLCALTAIEETSVLLLNSDQKPVTVCVLLELLCGHISPQTFCGLKGSKFNKVYEFLFASNFVFDADFLRDTRRFPHTPRSPRSLRSYLKVTSPPPFVMP